MADQPEPPAFDPAAPHHTQPKLRPIQGFPAKAGNQQVLGLKDATQISTQVVLTGPMAQFILPSMDGEHTVEQIVSDAASRASQANAPQQALDALTIEATQQLIAQLDNAGLIEGPRFDEMLAKMRADFDASQILPPGPTADIADALVNRVYEGKATPERLAEEGPATLRKQLEAWSNVALEQVSDPSFDTLPLALITPHSDYQRGWLNYAHAYGRMRIVDPPDRVVIFGVNHAGRGKGIVGCNKGFRTPLGTCALDTDLEAALTTNLGSDDTEKYYAERYDHEREPSIELQLPWLQHAFGPADLPDSEDPAAYPKILGALIYDLTANAAEPLDDSGLALEPFLDALRNALQQLGGTTLVVAAGEMSHVGRAFGDQQTFSGNEPEATEFREKVITHDREMLKLVEDAKPDELLTSFAWNGNWSRWTGLGPVVAAIKLVEPDRVKVLNYAAAADNQGVAMVGSAAAAMVR